VDELKDYRMIQVSCGMFHSVCLSTEGDVFTIGQSNDIPPCPTNPQDASLDDTLPKCTKYGFNTQVVGLAAGISNCAVITEDGKGYVWHRHFAPQLLRRFEVEKNFTKCNTLWGCNNRRRTLCLEG